MKLISTIALLGSAHHVFAQDYNPSGRFELKHGDPDKMAITGTSPALEGEVYFTSSDDARFSYTVEYYDMSAAGENPTTCLSGSFVNVDNAPTFAVGGTGLLDHVSVFNLPDSIWNDNSAIVCARMESNVNGEGIDAIETLATVTRTFTGDFTISIATKTKNAEGFTSANNDNTIAVEPFLCDDSDNRIPNQSVEFAQGQDFKICVAYDASSAAAGDSNSYNIDALRNVNCAWEDPNVGKMIYDGDGLCLRTDFYKDVYSSSDCNGADVFSLEFDEFDRLVRVGNDDCLMNDGGWLKFRDCTDDDNMKFQYRNGFLINVEDGVEKCGEIAAITINRLRMLSACTEVTDTFTINFSNSDTLIDGSGAAQGLTDLSAPGAVMSFTGVVKSAYFANGNTELSCSGDVDLNVASRRLETTNNVRFSTRARALNTRAVQTRGLEEVETEFNVGIKLDPTASSSAAASTGMTSMVLMAAAGVLVALI